MLLLGIANAVRWNLALYILQSRIDGTASPSKLNKVPITANGDAGFQLGRFRLKNLAVAARSHQRTEALMYQTLKTTESQRDS